MSHPVTGEYAFRFQPFQQGPDYWRVDLSYKVLSSDTYHFSQEWTSSIDQQSASDYVWMRMQPIRRTGKTKDGLLLVDKVQFEIADHWFLDEALWVGNHSVEIRVWWSANGTTWEPHFWGAVDLSKITIKIDQIVGSGYVSVYQFEAIDCLVKLNNYEFPENIITDDSSYIETTPTVYNGEDEMDNILGYYEEPQGSGLRDIAPYIVGQSVRLIHIQYYMEELLKLSFEEHRTHTIAAPMATYGYGVNAAKSVMQFGYYYQSDWHYREFDDLCFWYDPFRYEWQTEIKNCGELLAIICTLLGFSLTTKHVLENDKWVRTGVYIRLDGENDVTVEPHANAVITARQETDSKLVQQSVCVTTRTLKASTGVDDYRQGYGDDFKLTTYWRTIGFRYPNTPQFTPFWNAKRDTMWTTLLVEAGGSGFHVVNRIKVNTTTPYTSTMHDDGVDMWSGLYYNGIAEAMAWYYYNHVVSKMNRKEISETYSRIPAKIGASVSVNNWQPLAKIADARYTSQNFTITEIEIDPETGTATIQKEGDV